MEYSRDFHDEHRENLRDYMASQRPRVHAFLEDLYLSGETSLRLALTDELAANMAVLESLWGRLQETVFTSPLFVDAHKRGRAVRVSAQKERAMDAYFMEVGKAFAARYFPTEVLPQEIRKDLPFPRLHGEEDAARQRRFMHLHQEELWERIMPFAYAQLTYFFQERYHAVLHDTYSLYPALFAYMLTREEFRVMFPIMCTLFLQANLQEKDPTFHVTDRTLDLVTDELEGAMENTWAIGMRDVARFPLIDHHLHAPTWLRAGQLATVPYRGITMVFARPMSEARSLRVQAKDVLRSTERARIRRLLGKGGNSFSEWDQRMPVGSAFIYSVETPDWRTISDQEFPLLEDELRALLHTIPTEELQVYICMMDDSQEVENAYLLEDLCMETLQTLGVSSDRVTLELMDPPSTSHGAREPRWCVDNTQGRIVCRFEEGMEVPYVYPMPVRTSK